MSKEPGVPRFDRFIGIDYSGAKTAEASLPGLRVFAADRNTDPVPISPPGAGRKYWSRRQVAEWLALELSHARPTIVGIDHGFSAPVAYFEEHQLPLNWPRFLEDFQRHWPTDSPDTCVDSIRKGTVGSGAHRSGDSRWRRLTEKRTRAKSIFHFDVPGSVAKSTHAGIPWIRYLRETVGDRLHCWPFDGWGVQPGKSVIAEVYPALWSPRFPREHRTPDEHDAYVIAASLRQFDLNRSLSAKIHPKLSSEEDAIARIEGWILGT